MKWTKHIFELIFGLGVFVPLGVVLWFYVLAVPLRIDAVKADDVAYARGDVINVTSIGEKAGWAATLCTAIEAQVDAQDQTGEIATQAQPRNFNDGSIKKVREHIKVPMRFEPGLVKIWSRVTYRCFGLLEKTVTTRRAGWAEVAVY